MPTYTLGQTVTVETSRPWRRDAKSKATRTGKVLSVTDTEVTLQFEDKVLGHSKETYLFTESFDIVTGESLKAPRTSRIIPEGV